MLRKSITYLFWLSVVAAPSNSMANPLGEVTYEQLIRGLACFDRNANNLTICVDSKIARKNREKFANQYNQNFANHIRFQDSIEVWLDKSGGADNDVPLPQTSVYFVRMESFSSDFDGDVINVAGILPRRKPEKSEKFEKLNALFNYYCDLSAMPEDANPHQEITINPKRISRLLKKNKQPSLVDWFRSLDARGGLSDHIALSFVIVNASKLREDLSNMQVKCRLSNYWDSSWGDWYSTRSSVDLIARPERFERLLTTTMLSLKEKASDKRSSRVKEISGEIKEISDEIASLRKITGKHHDLFLDVLRGSGEIGEFREVAKYPLVTPEKPEKGKWEAPEDYQIRLIELQRNSPVTLVYTLEPGPDYNYGSESFEIFPYLCDLEERSLVSSKSSFLYQGTNAYNAKRDVRRLQTETLIHRPKFDLEQKAAFIKALNDDKYRLTIPFARERLTELGDVQAICLHKFYPDSALSYEQGFPYTEETFSDPVRREETNRYIFAYPFAWALVDKDNKAVLASYDLANPDPTHARITQLSDRIDQLLMLQSSIQDL